MKALFKWNSSKRPRWVVIKIRTARILVKNEKEKKRHPYPYGPQGNYPEWEKAHLERWYAAWFHLYVTVVQSLSRVRLFATLCTVALQASLSFTISRSLLKFMFIESVRPSNHLILCHPLLLLLSIFPGIRAFPVSWLFTSGGQSIGASASVSVLPMNTQGWFPLGLTGLISLLSKELLRVFSSTTARKHQFFCAQPSLCSNSLTLPG